MSVESIGARADLTVAGEIRAELARQRFTQTELVRRLGVSRPWLVRRLSGATPLSMADIATIADILNVPVAQLVAPLDGTDRA